MSGKKCTRCKETFPATLEYFYKNKKCRDELSSWCKKCSQEYTKKWMDSKTPKERKNYQKKHAIRYKLNHPEMINGMTKKERLRQFSTIAPDPYEKLMAWGFKGRPPKKLGVILHHFRTFLSLEE